MAVVLYDHRGELIEEAPLGPIDWREAQVELMENRVVELQERILGFEIDLENLGWERISGTIDGVQFSRQFLRNAMHLTQMMYLKNPLINRAVEVQKAYVWGQGVSIKASDDRVNEVIQEFIDDRKNRAELTSQQSYEGKEETLQTTGNIFFVFFPNPSTGMVRVRTIPADQIEDIICDPDDARNPWFYKRVWNQAGFDLRTGMIRLQQQTVYYPDWHLQPTDQMPEIPDEIGGKPVEKDHPIYHVKVGGLAGQKFGMPEVYAALDWARAAKEHLEDWAAVWRSLNQFAWSLKTQHGTRGVAAAKAKLGTTAGQGQTWLDRNPPALPGSTFISTGDIEMTPMRAGSVRPSPEESHYLWLMVASACGLPEIFFGNADVGNHATAKTLDRPTELRMTARQTLWVDILGAILDYVVMWAVRAPDGLLSDYAMVGRNRNDDDDVIKWGLDQETGKEIDPHVEVKFPDLLEHDVAARIAAIVSAATLNGHPNLTLPERRLVELLLSALGIDDVDEEIMAMFPEDGGAELEPNPDVEPAVQEAARILREALARLTEATPRKKRNADDEEEEPEFAGPDRRNSALAPLVAGVTAGLAGAARMAPTSQRTRSTFTRAYTQAYRAGLEHGNPDHVWTKEDRSRVNEMVATQIDYLKGFVSAAKSGELSDSQRDQRASLYGAPLAGAYSQGFVEGGTERGIERWEWRTVGDANCCEKCAPRDGNEYSTDELPGYPGTGDFGSDLCLGGPQCRCWLEPVE